VTQGFLFVADSSALSTPADFPGNHCELDFDDRAKPEDLTDLGKLGMGYSRFEATATMTEGQKQAIKIANSHLFD
jgi:hypothetical protein